jgi:ATP-dependent Lon protease
VKLNFDIPGDLPGRLPVLALRQGFILPGMAAPFGVGRAASLEALRAADGWVLVAMQTEPTEAIDPAALLPVAVLTRILHPIQRADGAQAVVLQGVARVRLGAFVRTEPHLEAAYSRVDEVWPDSVEAEALRRAVVESVEKIAEKMNLDAPVTAIARGVDRPAVLVDLVGGLLESDLAFKHALVTEVDPLARARRVLQRARELANVLEAQQSIEERVRSEFADQQREAYLRKQLEAIQSELGEGPGGGDDLTELKAKLAELELPETVRASVDKELARAARIQPGSPERTTAVDWLELVAELPWTAETPTDLEVTAVEAALADSHQGLDEVKKQVLENLAVRKLAGTGRADVLLLVGPPGVGKTSIAEAIASATDRKLVRVALGGMRDEAELRGHRRTYVGARPGRLIESIRKSGTRDPVVLLDEVDKLGRGYQGDPSAALLEILDPEQNHAFVDHYLEVPFDLSKALFIATANDLSTVPSPLLDRMEVVSIEGYTRQEKAAIARAHVLPKLAVNAGLTPVDVSIDDAAIDAAIDGWTREAGVRQLQRTLGKVFRAVALRRARGETTGPVQVGEGELEGYLGPRKFRETPHEAPARAGIATGLAWTPMGGDVLYVEASELPGSGQLLLTGQLGDVMKESARAALTYALSHADELGVPEDVLEHKDVHLHVPAGATPKDGPSAGVTMFTALASLLSGRSVRADLAMTGEVSLRGRVLPVGGIKSKVLAAHDRGLRQVILPAENAPDVEQLPAEVKSEMDVHLVHSMSEVLELALEPPAVFPPRAEPATPEGGSGWAPMALT